MNHLFEWAIFNSQFQNTDYDKDGIIASSGKILPEVLKALSTVSYQALSPPKSLGREYYLSDILPLLNMEVYSYKIFIKYLKREINEIHIL